MMGLVGGEGTEHSLMVCKSPLFLPCLVLEEDSQWRKCVLQGKMNATKCSQLEIRWK